MEYCFLNWSSDFSHLFLRQNDNLSEISRSEFQNLKKIYIKKKCVFWKSWKYILEHPKKTDWTIFAKYLTFSNDVFKSAVTKISMPMTWTFKGTFMQIEKTLINDHLGVSKVSWNFCIPTISNFAVIYQWYLPFS